MERTIIINAGHSLTDPGASYNGTSESTEAIKIRDQLIPLLKNSFNVLEIPDDLSLVDSIKWVNSRCKKLNDGLAISIHLNAGGGIGAEAYYYAWSAKSKSIANKILNNYCQITGFENRTSKPDTKTRHGRLGWIRDINTWSCLIEACFIDNKNDLDKLQRDYSKVAWGIYVGICSVYGINPVPPNKKINKNYEQVKSDVKKYLDKIDKAIEKI